MGSVRKEDRDKAVEAGVLAAKITAPSDPKPKGVYSKALVEDINRVRLAARQTALLAKPELILDLLAFSLCQKASGTGFSAFDIDINKPENTPSTETGFTLDDRLEHPETCPWGSGKKYTVKAKAKAFTKFQKAGKKHRNKILSAAFARVFTGGDSDLVKAVSTTTGASLRSIWTPTDENFFKRITGDALQEIYDHIMGDGASPDFAKLKKAGKVDAMHRIFNDGEIDARLNADQKSRRDTWEPKS